jgi:hypothetical protein
MMMVPGCTEHLHACAYLLAEWIRVIVLIVRADLWGIREAVWYGMATSGH